MHIRVPAPTHNDLHAYAAALGISDSAAAAILIRRGLDAEAKDQR